MKSFKYIIIICFSSFYLNGQNKTAEQYFYNKAVDLILENSTFSLNSAKIFILDKQVSSKPFLDNFKDRIPNNLLIDTSIIIKMVPSQNISNQYQLTILDESFQNAIKFENIISYKIQFRDAVKINLNGKFGYMLFFNTEYSEGSDFIFDNFGVVYGWVDRLGYFENIEYRDGIIKSEPYIPLINID